MRHNAGPGKMLPDWKGAKVNPLPEDIDTGIMPITKANVSQFRHK